MNGVGEGAQPLLNFSVIQNNPLYERGSVNPTGASFDFKARTVTRIFSATGFQKSISANPDPVFESAITSPVWWGRGLDFGLVVCCLLPDLHQPFGQFSAPCHPQALPASTRKSVPPNGLPQFSCVTPRPAPGERGASPERVMHQRRLKNDD